MTYGISVESESDSVSVSLTIRSSEYQSHISRRLIDMSDATLTCKMRCQLEDLFYFNI